MLYPPTPFPSRVPPDDNSFFTLPLELDEFSLDELPLELLPEENLTAEKIDAQIENAADTPEEALYYKRFEVIRSQMNHQFMNLDQQMLENLIDTKIYEQIFPDTNGAEE